MGPVRIQLPSELFAPAENAHFEGAIDLPAMKAGPDLYTFCEPLRWQVDVTNTGDAFLVTGTVEGVAATSCARCLADFSFPVTGEVEGYFLIDPDAAAPDDMDADEFDVLPRRQRHRPYCPWCMPRCCWNSRWCPCAPRTAWGCAPRAAPT